LAVGAHRGIHVVLDDPFPDSLAVAHLLKAAITEDGEPNLIFMGKQSVDAEGMQTHYRLAGALGMSVATEVTGFALEDGKAVVTCEAGNGEQDIVELALPCVVAATKGLNEPRYPKLPDIMKAGKKEVRVIPAGDLGLPAGVRCARVLKLNPVPERGQAVMLEGDLAHQVSTLIRLLREEKKVL
jgi:electron transfer flavoprotein beta subunit